MFLCWAMVSQRRSQLYRLFGFNVARDCSRMEIETHRGAGELGMNSSTRTSHPKPFVRTSIQTKKILSDVAQKTFDAALQKAYEQGIRDAESSTRDHPPYGFSDLKMAWRRGWLEASQKRK